VDVGAETEPDPQALIEEARRRHRRRRRWTGVAVLVLGLALGVALSVSGGSGGPPMNATHESRSNGSVKTTTATVPPLAPPSVVINTAGRLDATSAWADNVSNLFVTHDQGATWQVVTPLPSLLAKQGGPADRIQSVVAVGANDLWLAAGDVIGLVPFSQSADGSDRGAAIFRSTDGGTTWATITLPGCVQACGGNLSLSFVDALHGFATIGPGNSMHTHVYSTTDGGSSWNPVSVLFTPPIADIVFTTVADGWALTDPTFIGDTVTSPGYSLLQTTDGGVTWTQPLGLPAAGMYEAPTFFGAQDGVVLRSSPSPVVFATTDGGGTWSSHRLPIGASPDVPGGGFPFSAASPSTWVALTPSALVETGDSGLHWTSVPTPIGSGKGYKPLVFFSARDGWVAGTAPGCANPMGCLPGLYATHDGGRTWKVVSP